MTNAPALSHSTDRDALVPEYTHDWVQHSYILLPSDLSFCSGWKPGKLVISCSIPAPATMVHRFIEVGA